MPQLAANTPPPPDYYASNVRRLLDHVADFHRDLLSDEERGFLSQVRQASTGAQRLFARMLSRRGPWLRQDKLCYNEVRDLTGAVAELTDRGLILVNPEAPADALLTLFTQEERRRLFPAVGNRAKSDWIKACVSRYPDGAIRKRLASQTSWLEICRFDHFAQCQLLYFGDGQQDLSTFVREDLGVLHYERYPLCREERQFANREALERFLYFRHWRHLCARINQHPTLAGPISNALVRPAATRLEQRHRDKALNALGRWHERRGEIDEALSCYDRSNSHPARERRVRLLHKLGAAAARDELLNQMRSQPLAPEEEDFARRFGRRNSQCDIPISEAEFDASARVRVETLAATTLTERGGTAWHLENRLPLGLTGLAFWSVVFAPVPGAFNNYHQAGPVDLFWPDFARLRQGIIDRRLNELADGQTFHDQLWDVWREKRGIANRLVSWEVMDEPLLQAILEQVPHSHLLRLVGTVIRNLHRLRTGFPDLLVIYGKGDYEFVEVKGPTDQLHAGQRTWFRTLADLELPARVLKFRL